MKKPARFLRVVATLGMLAGLLAVFGASPAAAASDPGWTPGVAPSNLLFSIDGAQEVYFPWVYNNDNFGLGEADGSVTIQNLTHTDGYVFFYVGTGDGFDYTTYAFLAGGASKTFSADAIGVPEPGAPVIAGLYEGTVTGTYEGSKIVCEWEYGVDIDGDGDAEDCVPVDTINNKTYLIPLWAGGLVKSAVAGQSLPYTTSADTSVSGYNGLSGAEVDLDLNDDIADGVYLPIVQTNGGPGGPWDTRVTVANLGVDANAAVTLRFFPNDGDGSGSLNTGWQQNILVNVGDVYQITLSDYVPTGWTGSVHILSDDKIGAIADRFKVGTDMWLTNIGSQANFEVQPDSYRCGCELDINGGLYYPFAGQYVLFAPTVYLDYNGWNTGFSVANLVDVDNNVNIQYVQNGNAIQVVTQRIAPHGMVTAYRPSAPAQDQNQQNPMYDQVAGALILSDYPVAAAVDAVKYFGNDQNVGQAMTYNATANLSIAQAMPLVQKGNPATGMGATSGLTLLNPLPIQNSMFITWLNQSGFNAANFGTSVIIVPAQSIGIAYTMTQHNLPNGYYGSAVVHANLPFTMTSGNVDYQVNGDGSVIWNGYNPCGLFRAFDWNCVWGYPEQPVDSTLTKVVEDEQGEPVVGARVVATGTDVNGDYFDATGLTGDDGSITFDIAAGLYDIEVTDPPAGYMFGPGSDLSDSDVLVAEGADVTVTNVVNLIPLTATINKTVIGVGIESEAPLDGLTVAVFPAAACPALGDVVTDLSGALGTGTTNAAGLATIEVQVGAGTVVCVVVLDPQDVVVSLDVNGVLDLDLVGGDTVSITNRIDTTATINKTVLSANGQNPVRGAIVALYPTGSCPALGDVVTDLTGAIVWGTANASGQVSLEVEVGDTGLLDVCLIAIRPDTDVVIAVDELIELTWGDVETLTNYAAREIQRVEKTVLLEAGEVDTPLAGVTVALFADNAAGTLCPAMGATPDLDAALAVGTTNASGVATLSFDSSNVAYFCIVVLGDMGQVIDRDTDISTSGELVAITNIIQGEPPAATAILDVHFQGVQNNSGTDTYLFQGACPDPIIPGNANFIVLDETSSFRLTVEAGPWCIAVDVDGDGDIDLSEEFTIAAGDPAENGAANSDIVVREDEIRVQP